MVTLKTTEPRTERCDCGQGDATRLTGVFLDDDGAPCGLYYAMFTDHHAEHAVAVIISVGDFSDGASPDDREAFAFAIRRGLKSAEVIVKDATQSVWSHVELLGKKLTDEEARQHPRLQEVFAMADRVILDDPPVLEYLRKPQDSGCASCGK